MLVSILDLFSIGIGPSSSHAIGPMRAAARFVQRLHRSDCVNCCRRIEVRFYGSLALTGKGHGTDKATILGLVGEAPETVDPDQVECAVNVIHATKRLTLPQGPTIEFDEDRDFSFLQNETLPYHQNGMRFLAYDDTDAPIDDYTCYSIGGGFVVDEFETANPQACHSQTPLPYPYATGDDLLRMAEAEQMSISALAFANEECWREGKEVRTRLLEIWRVMEECVARGCRREGLLPGGLKVPRRAPGLYRLLTTERQKPCDALATLDWVNLFALAVSEENASGARVVTAPTNGAAGVIPAVLHYYKKFTPHASDEGVMRFLLCAGAIGTLYKLNASLSGAEVGCQGEVGVACSMAAGGLTEVLGGSPRQVEMAAEIGMEHNLGLTCDPIGGLVQVPCIERCAMAAVKAVNASRMALAADGTHHVSLDRVIHAMRETGRDMLTIYKETSRGGLAVAITEC